MKIPFLFPITALLLMACGGSKPSATADTETDTIATVAADAEEADTIQYDCTDAISMGLNGHVQQVSAKIYSTYDNNGKLVDGELCNQYEMVFDARGHMTTDEWGNEYGYDAEGKYYRGNHTYTTVKRDKAGRIIEYHDIEAKKDHESQFEQTFRYDKNGRITSVTYGGGFTSAWTEKRRYSSGNIYPAKTEQSISFEGGGSRKVTITYRYTSFDERHNWTERLCMISSQETEEEPVDSFMPESPTIKEEIQVEKREIVYFD